MKILYTTDLHGNMWKYKQLVQEAERNKVDMVINGGDMLLLENNLLRQKDFVKCNLDLDQHFKQFEEKGIYYLFCLGNEDLGLCDGIVDEICVKYPHVVNLAQRKYALNGYDFIGMNFISDCPFQIKDRCRKDTRDFKIPPQFEKAIISDVDGLHDVKNWKSYINKLPTLQEELEKLPKPVDMKKAIYVIHMPPANIKLDICGEGSSIGSAAIYDFINMCQPLLTLHGHVHESPIMAGRWKGVIGETVCVQPGQMEEFVYVLINLATMEYQRIVV
jgi:Icc-related predicted phosphoesterase